MALSDMIHDPATGKIKPAVLIGGGGIAIAGVYLLMTRGSSSGVTSGGQSSTDSGGLGDLASAIQALAAGYTSTGTGGSGSAVFQPPPGRSVSPPTINGPGGLPTQTISKLGGQTTAITPVTKPPVVAVGKPSNSGLSPAPAVQRTGGAVIVNPTSYPQPKPRTVTRTPSTVSGTRVGGALIVSPTKYPQPKPRTVSRTSSTPAPSRPVSTGTTKTQATTIARSTSTVATTRPGSK